MSSSTFVAEKVDVYALGNVLYHIWTTHSPRGKMKKERMEEVRDVVRQGIAPDLPKTKSSIGKAFNRAMQACFKADPKKRATVKEVAWILFEALEKVETGDR